MNQQAERGQQWLEQLLMLTGLPTTVQIKEVAIASEENSHWLNIDSSNLTPEQIAILIGEKGSSIDAIQYLANTILNLSVEEDLQGSHIVELDGYRLKRHQELSALAEQVAQQVRETKEAVAISALSSAERRQIHTFLKDAEDLETESQGQEPDRKLVVRLR